MLAVLGAQNANWWDIGARVELRGCQKVLNDRVFGPAADLS